MKRSLPTDREGETVVRVQLVPMIQPSELSSVWPMQQVGQCRERERKEAAAGARGQVMGLWAKARSLQ